jgi:hypothetical protein
MIALHWKFGLDWKQIARSVEFAWDGIVHMVLGKVLDGGSRCTVRSWLRWLAR